MVLTIDCRGAQVGNRLDIGTSIINLAAGKVSTEAIIPPIDELSGNLLIVGAYFQSGSLLTLHFANSGTQPINQLTLPLVDLFTSDYVLSSNIVGSPLQIINNTISLLPNRQISPQSVVVYPLMIADCGDCILDCQMANCNPAFDFAFVNSPSITATAHIIPTQSDLVVVGSYRQRPIFGDVDFLMINNLNIFTFSIALDGLAGPDAIYYLVRSIPNVYDVDNDEVSLGVEYSMPDSSFVRVGYRGSITDPNTVKFTYTVKSDPETPIIRDVIWI